LYAGEDRFANKPDTRPNLHIIFNPCILRDPDILADGHIIPHYNIHVDTCAVAQGDVITKRGLAADKDIVSAPESVANEDIAKDNAVPANRVDCTMRNEAWNCCRLPGIIEKTSNEIMKDLFFGILS
jgi:hypothetical protein